MIVYREIICRGQVTFLTRYGAIDAIFILNQKRFDCNNIYRIENKDWKTNLQVHGGWIDFYAIRHGCPNFFSESPVWWRVPSKMGWWTLITFQGCNFSLNTWVYSFWNFIFVTRFATRLSTNLWCHFPSKIPNVQEYEIEYQLWLGKKHGD